MMIAWPIFKIFLATYWKPIAVTVAVIGVIGWHKHKVNQA
jgi:hypothetical protein